MFDMHNNIKILGDLVSQTADDVAQVVTCDLLGFQSLEFLIAIGTLADANATFAVLVEDSPDNSAWTAVHDDFLLGTEAGAAFIFSDDNKVEKLGYCGNKRYCRITVTPSGNTGASDLAILGLGGHPIKAPYTAQEV